MRQVVSLAFGAWLAASAAASAPPRPPSFLDPTPAQATLETLHLEARAAGPARVAADGRGTVAIDVVPKARMQVYAADAHGYVPLTLKLAPPALVVAGKVTYPAAETAVFPPTGETSRVYMRPFRVTATFTLTDEARKMLAATGTLSGLAALRYQACDDRVCYRPASGTVPFVIAR